MAIQNGSFILQSRHGNRRYLSDVRYERNGLGKPVLLFIHGFKGFKDWGYFNLMADHICRSGFVMVKTNLSHNGTTPEDPLNFADLEAFGHNNYSIELDDIEDVLNHIESQGFPVAREEMDLDQIYLMGHSRGGGISIVKASEDSRIKKLVTWASVPSLTSVMPIEALGQWKEAGVHYIFNSRTKQEMPLYYQIAEDYLANEDRLDVLKCESNLNIPHLIVHGDNDETVPVEAARIIHEKSQLGQLCLIQGGDHVLGGAHPFKALDLPPHALSALRTTVEFLQEGL